MSGKTVGVQHSRRSLWNSHKNVRFNRVGLVVETGLLVAFIVTFNLLALDLGPIGFVTSAADPGSFVPLVAPGIKSLVPWFNLWLGMALMVNLVNFLQRRWHPITRLADLVSGVIGLCVLTAALILGPALVLEPSWAADQAAAGVSLESIEQIFLPIVNTSLFIAAVIALVALLAASARKSAFLLRSWRPEERGNRTLIHVGIGLAIAFTLSGPLTLVFDEFVYLGLGIPLGLGLGFLIDSQFSESRT